MSRKSNRQTASAAWAAARTAEANADALRTIRQIESDTATRSERGRRVDQLTDFAQHYQHRITVRAEELRLAALTRKAEK